MDTPRQKIKKLMIDHNIGSIADLAREYERKNPGKTCSREQMSMCINGQREYPEFQEFLASKFETTVEQLFGRKKKVRKAA
ncbi:MAG TPA: hypothetical protein VJU84_08850 [Pyrinomonadaceae bacterium]|nr:hypothetical protein [Pyrinomonadaceae bacterium]